MKIYRNKKYEIEILGTYDQLMNSWQIDYNEKEIKSQYGTTHINITGNPNGKPILLFHGVGDDSALMWLYNAKALGEKFLLYTVDTLGGPGKSRPNANYNKEFDDSIWIDEILNELKLDKVDIIGVSHGGYLAQYYKLHRPHRVNKVISMASSVPASNGGSAMKTMMKIFLPEALFPTKKNVTKLMKKLAGKNYNVFTDNDIIMKHYTCLLKGFNNMSMAYHKVTSFTDNEIDFIRDSSYYIIGEEDPFAKLGGMAMLKEYNMNTRFYKDAGHGINHEIAEEVNELIIEILNAEDINIRNY